MYSVFRDSSYERIVQKMLFKSFGTVSFPEIEPVTSLPVRRNTDHHHDKALCPILKLIGYGPEEVQGLYHFRNVRKELESLTQNLSFRNLILDSGYCWPRTPQLLRNRATQQLAT